MRSLAGQLFQVDRRNPQIARDTVKLVTIELSYLSHLATMLEPVGKGRDHELEAGIGLRIRGHGTSPAMRHLITDRRGVVALDQTVSKAQTARPPRHTGCLEGAFRCRAPWARYEIR